MVKVYLSLLVLACFVCNAQTQPGCTPLDPTFFARIAEAEASPAVSGYPFNLTNGLGAIAVYDAHTAYSTNGGTYTVLSDIGPFGWNLTNASSDTTWWIRNSSGLDGRDTLVGDGKNVRSATFSATQPTTYVIVCTVSNQGTLKFVYDSHNSGARQAFFGNPRAFQLNAGSTAGPAAESMANLTNRWVIYTIKVDGASSYIKTNNVGLGGTFNPGAQGATGHVLGANNGLSFSGGLGYAAHGVFTNISAAQELSIYQIYTNRFPTAAQ